MVPSPCIGICTVNEGRCMGCNRTLDEIAAWPTLTDDEKMEVLEHLLLDSNQGDSE